MATLLDDAVLELAKRTLTSIQEIPSLKHTPILDRLERERDLALDKCVHRCLEGSSERIQDRIKSELFEFGPLSEISADTDVSEIIVMGPESIWVERHGRLLQHNDRFLNRVTYRGCLNRILQTAKTTIDESKPFANGRWGEFRLHVASAPIVHDIPCLTLRRIRSQKWTLHDLLARDWATQEAASKISNLVRSKKNVLVIGSTGSGKTSALSAALNEVSNSERILIIEDTDEIPLPTPISLKLLSKWARDREDTEFGLGDLVKQSLRMRPDRIVMGEVRGPEAKDLLMAFATGHEGCWGTLHAANAREALLRLEMLVQMGSPQWSTATVRSLIHSSVHYIITVERLGSGARRLACINKVSSLEEMGFCFSTEYQA